MPLEQIEVIEHRIIEEGRRPSGGALLPPYTSTIRESRESYEQRADGTIHDRRFEVTGERDVSREPSFLHTSANYGQHIELSPQPQRYNVSGATNSSFLNTSGDSRLSYPGANTSDETTVINNYGYDIHEVHTTEGGARIIETHGSGPLRETSRIEHVEETVTRPLASAMRKDRSASSNIFTVPTSHLNVSHQLNASDNESLARKDSYRAMQSSWDGGDEKHKIASSLSATRYPPQSQTSLVSRETGQTDKSQGGCWQRVMEFVDEVRYAFRNAEYTPALLRSLCCILLLLILLLILLFVIFNAIFHRYAVSEFLLYPPVCEECRRKNPALVSAALPSSVFVHFYSKHQAHFELRGNAPFKSNSFTAIDFTTGYAAIADHSLTDANGRHFTCFLMPLDRTAIDSVDQLSEAVTSSDYEIQSTYGWQEFWQFDPEPIEPITANNKFTEAVDDCRGAKWYLLRQTVHARDASCSDCYDFCLPDWAVVRKEKYEDQSSLGVRRLNCFRFVETDVSGGHWKYPLSSESTKRDKNGEWVNWIPTTQAQGLSRTRKSLNNGTMH
uniref:BRICHOS domain-containing protein n=1 Tax=Caenorhabditis japonica TaxID=281687 RepID=A0A8R1HXS2_CAEJA